MFLIVGLGNPGEKFQNSRHNAGAMTVEELSSLDLEEVKLAKTKTFMNNSGKAIKQLIKDYKIKTDNLIIAHDDIDLPVGEFRIQKNRGAAGHKGVQSVIDELGTKDFWRLRIGICPKTRKPKDPEKFVLQKFTKQEKEEIKETIKKAFPSELPASLRAQRR